MGSKAQRQNQHVRSLMRKIKKWKKSDKNTDGLQKELAFCMGDKDRPEFKTGRDSDPRLRKLRRS